MEIFIRGILFQLFGIEPQNPETIILNQDDYQGIKKLEADYSHDGKSYWADQIDKNGDGQVTWKELNGSCTEVNRLRIELARYGKAEELPFLFTKCDVKP